MDPIPDSTFRNRLRSTLLGLFAVVVLIYPLDWAIWRLRQAAGSGMGTVIVTSTTAATMKGNRFEVFGQETAPVACSRSLLPQAGSGACWWLRRHPQIIVQY